MRRALLQIAALLLVGAVAAPCPAPAASAARRVADGNRALQEKRYDDALKAYEDASVRYPSSPEIAFDKAIAYYRKGDLPEATNGFRQAAALTRDLKLEARAWYNIGNCAFDEAGRFMDNDLKKALDGCQESVRHYETALTRDPSLDAARENMQVVRLKMKAILDELKKQQEQNKQEDQARKDAAEKLQKLIEKQDALRQQTQAQAQDTQKPPDSPEAQERSRKLASEQDRLRQQAQDLKKDIEKLPQPASATNAPSPKDAAEHVQKAAERQQDASRDLQKNQPRDADPDQREASRELKEALTDLSDKKPEGQPQPKPGDDQKQKNPDRQQPQPDQSKPQENAQNPPEDQMAALPDEAEDLIQEEKQNRDERTRQFRTQHREVEKDW